MAKQAGYHDYLLRLPEEDWQALVELVGRLRPKRSINQQIVYLIEQFCNLDKGDKERQNRSDR